jgi:PilZ domain
MALPLQVAGNRDPGDAEATTTENISPRGARVTVRRPRQPGELVLVTLRGGKTPARARVVYCQPLPGGIFGVGLQFAEPPWGWPGAPTGSPSRG